MTEYAPLLSPKEHEKWVNELIIPTFTQGRSPAKNPTFILITGQPGAGKSYSSHRYAQEHLEQTPVLFGADDIRALHPQAEEIMRTDRASYPFITKKDSGLARAKLLDYCFQHGYNIVVESILSSKDDYKMPTLLQAREQGYRVECAALAVHRSISEVSIFWRQEEQLAITKEIGFPPTLEIHDQVYSWIPHILANMNDYHTVDKLSIYTRSYQCYYDSDVDPKDPIYIKQRMKEGRNSYLNLEDMSDVAIKWREVLRMMVARGASQKEIDNVRELSANFMKNSGLTMSSEFRNYSALLDQIKRGGRD